MRREIDSCKAQVPCMPADVREGDDAGPALQRIQPVASPRIIADVAFAAPPDYQAVSTVKKNGQPDPERFQKDHHRQGTEKLHLVGIRLRAVDGGGIGYEDMLDQERAHGDDSAERVQAAKQEGVALAGA